jgi:hypothetical protein
MQYQQMKGSAKAQQYMNRDTFLTQEQASKMLSEAAYDSSLWGYIGAAIGVGGLLLLTGGTAAPWLLAGTGGISSYLGSEYGEGSSLAGADPIEGMKAEGGTIKLAETQKADAYDEIKTNLDAQQLGQAFKVGTAVYAGSKAIGTETLESLFDWDKLVTGGGNVLDDLFNWEIDVHAPWPKL